MKVCAWTFFGIPAAIVAILLAFILMNEHDETWYFHLDYQIGCRNALVQANLKTEPTDFAILDTVKKKPFWSKLTKDEFEQVEKAKADLAQVASK